jgi:hypothetical protein
MVNLRPRLHIPFIANAGQVANAEIAYYASTFHGAVYVNREGDLFYRLPRADESPGWVLKERFVGAAARQPRGEGESGAVSYFVGANERGFRQGLKTYDRLEWGEIYPKVQLSVRAAQASVEKIFTVLPGGDPGTIRMQLEGTLGVHVTENGELEADTVHGPARFSRPIAFQERDGVREPVAVRYRVEGSEYGFSLGAYDSSRPLVIDPLLASTYLGSSDSEPNTSALRMARDPLTGDVLIAGATLGADFPTTAGAYDETYNAGTQGFEDVFIARMSSDLSTLKAATFLGGTGADAVRGLALDGAGNIYVGGDTGSLDFPVTAGAVKASFSNYHDAFVAKLSPNLQTLMASTLIGDTGLECGSSGAEYASAMTVDKAGNVYLAGVTTSRTFPVTSGAYQTTLSQGGLGFPCGQDAFIVKLSPTLTSVLAGTYYGTGGQDNLTESPVGLSLDATGNVYIAGWAPHSTLPVTVAGGAFAGGVNDTYVAKFNSNLTTLLAARYIGGGGQDVPTAAGVDAAGSFYVVGGTSSTGTNTPSFPTTAGTWEPTVPDTARVGVSLGFAVRLKPTLELQAATYLHEAAPYAVSFDSSVAGGSIVVAGGVATSKFPFPANAYDSVADGFTPGKVFLGRFSSDLTKMLGATSLHGQCGMMCAVVTDTSGNVVVAGSAATPEGRNIIDLTAAGYDKTFNDTSPYDMDVFIAKLSANLSGTPNLRSTPASVDFGTLTVPVAPSTVYPTADITLDNPGDSWLRITSVKLGGADAGDFRIDNHTCTENAAFLRPAAVLPDENHTCVVSVSFKPFTVLSSIKSAELQVSSTDPDAPTLVIPLSGTTFNPELGPVGSGSGSGSGGDGGSGDGGDGGCSLAARPARFDPLVVLMLLGAAGCFPLRRMKRIEGAAHDGDGRAIDA